MLKVKHELGGFSFPPPLPLPFALISYFWFLSHYLLPHPLSGC